jgi:protein-L-isoaspartate(D-aspartate) O-methyltransferase
MGFLSHLLPRITPDRRRERERMVRTQIRERDIRDERVMAAMAEVPRHLFVLPEEVNRAHEDCALRIDEGQTISQPYIVALMLEALMLSGSERVLEVGTGSGYQTALLSLLAGRVWTVERHESLFTAARERLSRLGEADRVEFKHGDGTLGWPEHAPFDGIIVTAAGPSVPEVLVAQLSPEGRLVMPIGDQEEQMLIRVERRGEERVTTDLCPCRFVPLIGAEGFPR